MGLCGQDEFLIAPICLKQLQHMKGQLVPHKSDTNMVLLSFDFGFLLFYFHLAVLCMHECLCTPEYGGPEVDVRCLSSSLSNFDFQVGAHTELAHKNQLYRLARKLQGSSGLHFPSNGFANMHHHAYFVSFLFCFYMCVGNQTQVPVL